MYKYITTTYVEREWLASHGYGGRKAQNHRLYTQRNQLQL